MTETSEVVRYRILSEVRVRIYNRQRDGLTGAKAKRNESRHVYKAQSHKLEQVSTLVQPEYCRGYINASGLSERQEIGRTVSQLFDAQSAHLLTAALSQAPIGQAFLYGFVSCVDPGITSLTPNIPCPAAS